tara:strand:- start:4275 stop:6380 length:2106 start_codon:yes stop_codon:yes gene_type:complete
MATKREDQLLRDLEDKFRSSDSATMSWRHEAKKAFNYYENSQTPSEASQDGDSMYLTLNLIRSRVNTAQGILTSAKPKPEITGRGLEDAQSASGLKDVFEFSMDKDRFFKKFKKSTGDAIKCGLGVMAEELDPDMKQLTRHGWVPGDVSIRDVNPLLIYIDPSNRAATMSGKDGPQWVIEKSFEDLDLLKEINPNKKKDLSKIMPIDSARQGPPEQSNNDDYGSSDSEEMVDDSQGMDLGPRDGSKNIVEMKTMWYYDAEVVPIVFQLNEDGGMDLATIEGGQPITEEMYNSFDNETKKNYEIIRYPENTLRTRAAVGNVLLFDRPAIYRHQKIPYVFITGTQHHDNPMPYGEIHNLFDAQDLYNKLNSVIVDNAIRTNNTGYIIEQGVLDEEEEERFAKYGSMPGFTLRPRPGMGQLIREKNPGRLPEALFRIQGEVRIMFDELSGLTQTQRGGMPYETSGKAIIALQQAGDVAQDWMKENIADALTEWGYMRLSNIQQFYSYEKSWRISNTATEHDQYLMTEFTEGKDGQPSLGLFKLEDGNPEPIPLMNDFTLAEYDIRVSLGTGHERSRDQRLAEVQFLFSSQAVDREYLLQEYGVEGRSEIMRRMDERDQMMQMATKLTELMQDPQTAEIVNALLENPQQIVQALSAAAPPQEQMGMPVGGGGPQPPGPMGAPPVPPELMGGPDGPSDSMSLMAGV